MEKLKLSLSIVLIVLTVLSLSFAHLMGAATVLAFLGVLADVSYAENQDMAKEAAVYCAIAYGAGLVLLTGSLLLMRARRKPPS